MRLLAGWLQNRLASAILLVSSPPLTGSLAIAADFNAGVGSRFESNASNSDRPSDRLADGFFFAHAGVSKKGIWERDWRWHVGISAEGEVAFRFIDLSRFEGGFPVGVERKFGLGWKAPRLLLDVYPAFRWDGQPGASGFRLVPSLSFIWQFAERGGISISYLPNWFFAEGALFDSQAQEAEVSGWFDLFPATRLFLGYSFRHGDVVSYATPPRPDLVAIAEVREPTDVFGAERMAYRIDASTQQVQAGIDQKLTSHLRLRALYRFEITTRSSFEYPNHVAEIALRVRF